MVVLLIVFFNHFVPTHGAGVDGGPGEKSRLSEAYSQCAAWAKTQRRVMSIKNWTPENFGWQSSNDFPSLGGKASDCQTALAWLECYIDLPSVMFLFIVVC